MNASLNVIHLIGRIGVQPEMRYLESGRAMTRLRVATDRPVAADREPKTDWHDVVCFDETAEFANEYLDVGRLVFVAGSLQYRTPEVEGRRMRFAAVVAREVVPLDRRPARSEADEDGEDGQFHPARESALRDAA